LTSCEASRRVMPFRNSITSSRVAAMIAIYPPPKGVLVCCLCVGVAAGEPTKRSLEDCCIAKLLKASEP
jgi:hypothetical protein